MVKQVIFFCAILAMMMTFVLPSHTLGQSTGKKVAHEDGAAFLYRSKIDSYLLAVTPQKEFFVLGAGLPRTGTKSTKVTLKELGYKTVHMEDILNLGLGNDVAHAMHSDAALQKLVDKLLALGFNATVDFPMSGLVFRLSKMFPKAKVLYGYRDHPEEWKESFTTLMQKFRYIVARPLKWITSTDWIHPGAMEYSYGLIVRYGPCDPDEFPLLQLLPWYECITKRMTFDRDLVEVYRDWDERVRREFAPLVEKQQFLTYHVKQGWKPLAEFLGKAVPSTPFPSVNEAASLDNLEFASTIIAIVWPFVLVFALVLNIWISEKVMKVFRSVFGGPKSKNASL